MGLLQWFYKPDDDSFEAVFERLEASIQRRTEHLADVKQREYNAVVLFTTWSTGLWALYVAVWWMGILTSKDSGAPERAFYAAPLAIGPVITVFTRRSFRWWYRRKQNKEDAELKVLRKKQQEQIERFKKLTKYEETRTLLEKYDEKTRRTSLAAYPLRSSPGRGSLAGTPRGSPTGRGRGAAFALAPAINARYATPTRGGAPSPSMNGSPASRGWVDRFADKILGDDETAPQNKYALICGQCFAHNGLVLKAELATTQYICPKCGHMNLPKPQTTVAAEDGGMAVPRSRTYSALSPMAQSAVFGRHNHRHSMVDLPGPEHLKPPALPRRPSSTGDVESARDESIETDDEVVGPGEMSKHSRSATVAASALNGSREDDTDSDEMDEG